MSKKNAPLVFILSWERPLYLWACLDSLRIATRTPCRFVLLDNASSDPLVHKIIDSFESRDFFYQVHRNKENTPHALMNAIQQYKSEIGEYFGYIESDVVVLPGSPSWLEEFQELLVSDPKIAMLGSLIDKVDFIDPEWAIHKFPGVPEKQLEFLIKLKSPERALMSDYQERTLDVITPPGRLAFYRTEVIRQIGFMPDSALSKSLRTAGYKATIATHVRHRHLSLANAFDYPEYDKEIRDKFWFRLRTERIDKRS